MLEHWIVGHATPHQCSSSRPAAEAATAKTAYVEIGLGGSAGLSDDYTLIYKKYPNPFLGMRYELHDPCGTLVTSITLGTSKDAVQWRQVMGAYSGAYIPKYWCGEEPVGAAPPGWWNGFAHALAWVVLDP